MVLMNTIGIFNLITGSTILYKLTEFKVLIYTSVLVIFTRTS